MRKVLCIRTCVDSQAHIPYHAGETVNLSDEHYARWEEQKILKHFANPDTPEKPLLVEPEKDAPIYVGNGVSPEAIAAKIIDEAKKEAALIIAEAMGKVTEEEGVAEEEVAEEPAEEAVPEDPVNPVEPPPWKRGKK